VTAAALRPVAPDHAWRQSELTDWLRCGRAFGLRYSGVAPRADLDGWAALIGDAAHAAIAQGLRQRKAGVPVSPELLCEVASFMSEAFAAAVEKAQAEGATTDPEGAAGALERVDEMAELVAALLADPRLDAIEWRGIEEPFSLELGGRRFRGTRDAWGVCVRRVEAFAACGSELVALEPGDVVVADWKSGSEVAVDHCSRSHNVQLGLYRAGLAGHVRTFIGVLRDLERPVRPRADGEVIKSKIKELNPRWLELTGLEAGPTAESSKKRPTDPATGEAAPKWIERPNPAYVEACGRPKGPLFHEARIDRAVVAQTIADVIDAARLGIYPASGAASGACRRCAFRATCAHAGA
jgi:hypothetical protein